LPSLHTDQQQWRLLGWGGEGSAKGKFADAAPLSRKPHFPAVKSLVFADRLLLEVSLGDTTAMRFWLVA